MPKHVSQKLEKIRVSLGVWWNYISLNTDLSDVDPSKLLDELSILIYNKLLACEEYKMYDDNGTIKAELLAIIQRHNISYSVTTINEQVIIAFDGLEFKHMRYLK